MTAQNARTAPDPVHAAINALALALLAKRGLGKDHVFALVSLACCAEAGRLKTDTNTAANSVGLMLRDWKAQAKTAQTARARAN